MPPTRSIPHQSLFNGARKYSLAVTIAHQTTAEYSPQTPSYHCRQCGYGHCPAACRRGRAIFCPRTANPESMPRIPSPAALQNLTTGYGYARTPLQSHGIRIAVPSRPVTPLPEPMPVDELKAASKRNFGLMPVQPAGKDDAMAVPERDPDVSLRPTTPEATWEPSSPRRPTSQSKPTPTPGRRGRKRFEDDAGEALIEVC